ncbi:hypothetical protein RRG08_003885 [Elysia crispata]|uniref:Metallo-beta-lactamase domain-containing protein n=1 Tax=Elysia crispata TaxID=231223 RepID=A0AAE1DEE4_9GAST|nr:hypothetical protein RRG08_003885 [Elysia crispata]
MTELDTALPVLEPDMTVFEKSPLSGIRHLWIGHSTSLIQFDGITILTDPVFSDRCSPIKFVGNKRFRPTPCSIESLPKVDLVLISNANYDHLDYASVVALKERDIMGSMHADPEQAVTIHEDLRSQASIGIHWGTFSLAYEPYLEPRELLGAEIEKRNMKPSSFFTVSHGEISLVGADGYNDID